MLTKTDIVVDSESIVNALTDSPTIEFKHTINKPTGDFFYDPWEIKEEYKDTAWAKLIQQLPNIGEARIIVLGYGKCYQAHADIDDRYHLTLQTDDSYLIDLTSKTMHKLKVDNSWYSMDAGRLHSAANVGYQDRVQLVVRKLLTRNKLIDPLSVTVKYIGEDLTGARFKFDNIISPWLNHNNKLGTISNFTPSAISVRFDIEKNKLADLQNTLTEEFIIL